MKILFILTRSCLIRITVIKGVESSNLENSVIIMSIVQNAPWHSFVHAYIYLCK